MTRISIDAGDNGAVIFCFSRRVEIYRLARNEVAIQVFNAGGELNTAYLPLNTLDVTTSAAEV